MTLVIQVFCRLSPHCLLSWLHIWPPWTGSRSIWVKMMGHFINCVVEEPCSNINFKAQVDWPVQKLGYIWICLAWSHNWRDATTRTQSCQRPKIKKLIIQVIQDDVTTETDLRSARRQTVRAKCKAALLLPPDCEMESMSVGTTGKSGFKIITCKTDAQVGLQVKWSWSVEGVLL